MAYRDWLKEYRESQGQQSTTPTKTSSPTQKSTSGSAGSGGSGSSFRDSLKAYREAQATSSVTGWVEASINLMTDVQNRSGNWFDDKEYQSYSDRFTSLLAQADGWRKKYAGSNETISYIDSVVDALSEAKNYSSDCRKFYSQWNTKEDYKTYQKEQKDYEDMLNFDLEAGQKEIDALEAAKAEYKKWRLQTGEEVQAKYRQFAADYGDIEALEALISEKNAYLNRAKRLQDSVQMASVSDPSSENYDPEFRDYSQYVSTVKYGPFGKPEFGDEAYEFINNPYVEDHRVLGTDGGYARDFIISDHSSYDRDNPWHLAKDEYSSYERKNYDYMTDDEIAIYNYYYSKDGKEAADNYLESIQETLNHREATGRYKELEGNTGLELLFGVEAGIDQFKSGVNNLLNFEDDYIPATSTQMVSGMVREDLADDGPTLPDWLGGASLGQAAYDTVTTTANMAPSIITSAVVSYFNPVAGQVVGSALMGASAAGNAYAEVLNMGYDKSQARAYSTLIGASEAGLQYLLGGIGKLGGKLTGKALTKLLDGVDNAIFRTAIKLGGNMLSEGMEEGLQEVLTPWFQNLTLHIDGDINWSEVAYSSLLGALTAGFMEGGSTISGEVNTYKTGRQLQSADISAQRLAEIGTTFSADTVAYQLAGRVNENTGAYTMGRLFNEIGATMTEQNVNDITNALVAKGMDYATARRNAKALAYVVEGGQLTDTQIAVIEANDVLAEAARTTLIDANTTWNQRSHGYNEMLKALADEMASPKASRTKQAQQTEENAPTADMVDSQNEIGTESLSEAESVDTSPAKVKSISDIRKMTIKLEDGSEVNVRDADLDPDDGVRIETIASIDGISTEDANFVLNTLRATTNASAQMDSLGAKEAYKYGFYGFSQDHIAKHGVFANSLTDTQRQAIYDTGKNARQKQITKATPKKTTGTGKQTEIYFDSGNGNVVAFRDAKKSLTEKQTAGVQAAMVLRKLGIGGDIYFFESYRNSQGKLVYIDKNGVERPAPNGWYSEGDGSIHIDLNAGKGGNGFVLYTLAHELTHFIEQWSPQKYKILADFLVENYEKGQSMDKLVRAKQAKLSGLRGKNVPYKEAYSEVIADSMEAMLADGNVLDKLIELKAKDNSLFMKMKQFFDNLLAKIRNIYKGQVPDSAEGRAVLEMKDSIERIQQLFAEALVDASENYQSSLTPGEEGTVVNENGDPVAHSTADGTIQLSMRTYEEEGRVAFRAYLEKCVSSNRLTEAEKKEMLDGIEDIYQTCKEFKDKYAPFSTWSDAAVVRDTYGKPVFSVVTPNGDYKMNLDFSLVCKKRRTLDAVFNEMSRRGIIDDFELGQKSVVKINEIIRKYDLETACALCFVDAKRFRQASMADSFTRLYNELVLSLVPEGQRSSIDHFNFSGYETIKKVEDGIHTWSASKLDFSHLDEVMKNYGKGTVEHKAAKYIKTHAEGRKLLLRGDFMSSQGFDAVKTQNKDILKLYNSKKGTGGPKAAFGDVQYMNEIIKKARTWTPAKAYSVGGVRIQSFSDYVPRMIFDYVQMVYDLAATKLPAHAYTKEALFVKQFGLTGIKINMSLIPAIAEGGIAPGLDANGNYVWAGESFDYETAKEIQNAEGYTENCGTICVGVSQKHIEKLLRDPNIRMVIPYHKSGLNPIVAHMNKIAEFTDYTNDQRTKGKDGKALDKDFDFSKALHDMGENASPKAVADQYLKWCVANGYTPRFAEFALEDNYYKLLEDFTLYDKDGNYGPQREVRAVFPKEDSAFGSMKDLIKSGLEEDAVIEGKRDKNLSSIVDEIQKTLPKTEAEIAETQVEQADRDLEAEVKYSSREYSEQVDEVKNNTHDPLNHVYMGTTPVGIAKVLDLPKLPMLVTPQHIYSMAVSKAQAQREGRFKSRYNYHNLGWDTVKKLPEYINKPVLIIKSNTDPNDATFVVVTAQGDSAGNPIIVAVKPNGRGNYFNIEFPTNFMLSGYGKDGIQNYVAKSKTENRILYASKKNSQKNKNTPSVQFADNILSSDYTANLAQFKRIVKTKFDGTIFENSGLPKFSDRDNAPTFYSQMAKVVVGMKQEKFGASSVISMLRGRGVKAEEIKWSGIETWLDGKKSVTKAELQEFIAGSMLQIVEEQSSNDVALRYVGKDTYKLYDAQGNVLDTFKYSEFIGGYISEATDEIYSYTYEIEDAVREEYGSQSMARWGDYKLHGGSNYREFVFRLPNSSYSNQAMRVHWGDEAEGVLAHARVQDFGKMLFIEEIQSDWHNEGHQKGYIDESKRLTVDNTEMRHEGEWYNLYHNGKDLHQSVSETFLKQRFRNGITEEQIHEGLVEEYNHVAVERKNGVELVPDAPFKGSYHEYVLKRLLRMAAEQDYDSIGWTTADIQSDRWSEKYAEGYRIEYDQDIPKFLNKYGKQWGTKVGKTVLDNGTEVWSMAITDSMKESVLTEGQPLYSDRDSEGNSITAEQSTFFAQSKARDKDGNLLLLYHGTARAGFTIFDPSKGKMGGNWFTTSRLDADSYAGNYKHKLFDPNETDEVRSSVGGNFTLGSWMRFDTEADRADFLKQYPNAEKVKTEAEYDELLKKADDARDWDEYDHLEDEQYKNRKELQKLQRAYDRYEWEHSRDATIGELFETPERFSVSDIIRAWDALDSNNAARDEEYTKEDLIEGLREEHNRLIEDGEDGLTDFPFKARLPVGESGDIVNRSNNRTYAVYVNAVNPFEINANQRTLHGANLYPVIERGLKDSRYDSVIVRDVRVGAHEEVGDVVIIKDSTQVKLASNKAPTEGTDIRYQDRADDSVSNRSLLANAFEGVAQNAIERNKIQEYKGKISLINLEEQKLHELNEKIKELSFSKGPRDTKAIRDLQFEARQTANRINTYDKQLLRLEASQPLQDVLTREKKQAYKRAEQKGKEALAAYRERATKTQRELLEKWQESRKKGIESREKTAMRHKIQHVVGELNQLLLSNDKKRHVPDSLKKAVADALALVNMDTVGAEERAAKYAALIAKETDPDKIDAYTVTMENILRQGEKMGQRLKELRDAYEEIAESDDPDIANAYDPVIAGSLKELAQSIGNTSLRNMTLEQLSDVYDMYRMVLTRVRDANKSFLNDKKEAISNLASRVVGEVRRVGGEHKYRASILDPVKKFFWDNQKPIYAMESIGSNTLTDAFMELITGEGTYATDVSHASKFADDKKAKYKYDEWDFKKKYRFGSTSGLEFELTLEQILSLYAYSKRNQAHDHLRLGGFVFDSNIETYKEKDGKKGKSILKYKVNTADAHQLTPEILADIIGKLSKEQMAFVDEMQNYLSTVMGAKGNEVTMKMYGVKLFKEKFYFPLKSAKQFMFEQNEVSGEVKIKNSGFTNKVVAKANNPVILSNFMDVWANHVHDMSMYHSFVLPLEDFNRIFNYNSPKKEGQPPVSVKGTIQSAYSPAAVSYVKQLITDLNGGARSDPRESTAKALMGRFKKASVFASNSVVIQQPSALLRAQALVDAKYFSLNPKLISMGKLWEEAKQYAPVAIIKEMGHFDMDTSRGTVDYIKGDKTFMDKVDDVFSWAPAKADEWAWVQLWAAVKKETAAKHKDMKVGSEEFLKAAGKRFTEVIVKTQVYDSTLSRSANMRSKSALMSMATAFMAEPTTAINMLENGIRMLKRGYKKAAVRQFGAVYASVIANALLVSIVYAMRDDDEDETFLEKYFGSVTTELLDGFNPLTYYPWLKDGWSILQGFDVERSDMSLINDVFDALNNFGSLVFTDTENMSDEELEAYQQRMKDSAWTLVDGVASLLGVPLKNIRRDFDSYINTAKTLSNGLVDNPTSFWNEVLESTKNSIPVMGWFEDDSKTDKLYDAIVSGDTAYLERLKRGYVDDDGKFNESSYNTAIRKALRENDPRIKEAAQAKFRGDLDEYLRIAKEILAEKHFSQDNVVAAINAEINALDKGETTTSNPKASGMFKAEDFAVAISQGDSAMANAIKVDIIQTAQKNGKTEDEAEKSFASSAKTNLKELFFEGSISEGQAINALTTYCGDTQEDAEKRVGEWAFEDEYGFAYSDRGDAYKSGAISAYELKEILMDVGGKTEEEADLQIQVYDWEKEVPGCDDITVSAIQDYNENCAAAGISKSLYYEAWTTYKDTDGDYDQYGDSIPYSKVQKVMPYIDSLPLTSAQKTALALCWWAESTVYKYKTW